jgi:hypothetical protein
VSEEHPGGEGAPDPRQGEGGPSARFSTPGAPSDDYTDDRPRWEWKSKYPDDARKEIWYEEKLLLIYLTISILVGAFALSLSGQLIAINLPFSAVSADGASTQPLRMTLSSHVVAIYFIGFLGGTTFSIKWLVHACAKGKWHLDRRPWRLNTPLVGGVYACVVLTFLDSGLFVHGADVSRPFVLSAALAFLVGYFSDGVSGLLSNVANAVFGTLEKK